MNRPKLINASITPSVGSHAVLAAYSVTDETFSQPPSTSIGKAPVTVCTDRVKTMWAFSCEPNNFFRFHARSKWNW